LFSPLAANQLNRTETLQNTADTAGISGLAYTRRSKQLHWRLHGPSGVDPDWTVVAATTAL
jgi:hypothetical protein